MKSLTKIQSKRPQRAEAGPVPGNKETVNPGVEPLVADQRSTPSACSPAIDRDNFDQVLAGVLSDMNADDDASQAATSKDDEF